MNKSKEGAATPGKQNDASIVSVGEVLNGSDIDEEAQHILTTGDPITYILDVFNTIHVSDRAIGELLILSACSPCIKNVGGIHPKMSGESGKGKSHAGKTMLHLIPTEFWEQTSLSGKALYYHQIKEGTIIFSDDITLSEDLESLLRQSTTNFHTGVEHKTVDINRTGKVLFTPARIVWWLASVDDELDIQTLNRQVGVGVDTSTEADALVLARQLSRAATGDTEFPENDSVKICREMFGVVKKLCATVIIPYAEKIVWRGGSNRRNLDIFLDMVKLYALVNFKQRKTVCDSDDEYIVVASTMDFDRAADLYQDRAETQATKLTAHELLIRDFLAVHGPADVSTIAKTVGLSYHRVRRLLVGGKNGNGGMLGKVQGLEVTDMSREAGGGYCRVKEYALVGFDLLSSYSNIVSLPADVCDDDYVND